MKKVLCSLLLVCTIFLNLNLVEAKTPFDQCYEPCKDTCLRAYQSALANGDYSGMNKCTEICATQTCAGKSDEEVVAPSQPTENPSDNTVNTYPKINCSGIEVPKKIAKLVSTFINIIKIAVPILIIIYGSLDFAKAVMAQKEDEIKKGQQTFVKRLIAAVLVFLVFFIVEIVIGLVAPKSDAENQNVFDCIECFIKGSAYCDSI